MTAPQRRCDIFCTVVDNFGDAGICWRLARQLHHEHGWGVRLLIDRPEVLARLAPDATRTGVQVVRWDTRVTTASPPAQVVIEAFGCALPDDYLRASAAQAHPPLVINLEYLSAEAWIDGSHGLPSPGAAGGLRKFFYFPGFTPQSGGVLVERDHAVRQAGFDGAAFCREFGLDAAPSLRVSMFRYDNAPFDRLVDALAASAKPVEVLLPGAPGPVERRGALTLRPLPFLPQARYDELLWLCDLNFVRGEDSFVRAQLAGKPFVWQAYVQEGGAHHAKLAAFLERFIAPNYSGGGTADDAGRVAVAAFSRAWNGAGTLDWPAFADALPALAARCRRWRAELLADPDLCTRLVAFCARIVE